MFNRSTPIPLNNIGLYFYLVGSLVFLFSDMKTNNIPHVHGFMILFANVICAFVLFKLTSSHSL